MLIDGEKWACEACVRGHRVSKCQHHDRPLQHINKKGRPVSQCQYCRAMRKFRSAHTKCDCGEKTHKCVPEAGARGKLLLQPRRPLQLLLAEEGAQAGHGPRVDSASSTADSASAITGSSACSDALTQAQRRSKSEATSPLLEALSSFAQLNGQLPPLDLSGIKQPSYIPNSADFFGALSDYEQPMISAWVDWSTYEGLEIASKTAYLAPSNYSQPQSYAGFDLNGSEHIPTMTTTTSTSGEVSEVEEFGHGFGHPNCNLLGSTNLSSLDLDDFNYMKKDVGKFLPTPASMAGDDPTLLTTSAPSFSSISALDNDLTYCMNYDYDSLPNLTESPTESGVPSFWDGQ